MNLINLIPNGDVLLALDPEELGIRILQMLGSLPRHAQQHDLGTLIKTVVGDPQTRTLGVYPAHQAADIAEALREAWAWLEGQGFLLPDPRFVDRGAGPRILSRSATRIAKEVDTRRALSGRRVPKDSLHPRIREDVWSLYHRGKYDTAVFEAMKAVEVAVRDAADLSARDIGKDLMRKAFEVNGGPLTDMQVEPAERQARSDLFAGAIGSYKNPHSHRNVALDDPDETAEIIMLANHLLRIVDVS